MIKGKWCSVELPQLAADKLRIFLHKNCISFETSGCYNLIHFEVYITDEEQFEMIEDFLEFLPD